MLMPSFYYKCLASFGILTLCATMLIVWGAAVYVTLHFVIKYW